MLPPYLALPAGRPQPHISSQDTNTQPAPRHIPLNINLNIFSSHCTRQTSVQQFYDESSQLWRLAVSPVIRSSPCYLAKEPRELSHRLTAACLVSGTCDGDHI